jgi:hypothetical protein
MIYPRKVCPVCQYLNSEFVTQCEGVIFQNSQEIICGAFLSESAEVVTLSAEFTHLPKPVVTNKVAAQPQKVRVCSNTNCLYQNLPDAVECTKCFRIIQSVPLTDRLHYTKIHFVFSETTMHMDFTSNTTWTVGRLHTESMQILSNVNISRNHCVFYFKNGEFFIEDTSSRGTFINKLKLNPKQLYPIKDGDFISLYDLDGMVKFYVN